MINKPILYFCILFIAFTSIRSNKFLGIEKQSGDALLENWMGNIKDIIANQTILDLALPGTHDTMTYDLSDITSDGGIDDLPQLAQILHDYADFVPGGWIKTQAQTQALDIVSQLNNGIRFLDFRIMFTSNDWYSLHFLQTKQTALTYLQQVKQWIESHPDEIIVMWLSKHGNECAVGNDQFPNVTIETKQKFWGQIVEMFKDVIIDNEISKANETNISQLLQRNHRLIIYASDYVEFTNSSKYAIDGCNLDNTGYTDVKNFTQSLIDSKNSFMTAQDVINQNKQQNKFYLLSMANGQPGDNIQFAAQLFFTDIDVLETRQKCASTFNIPNMTQFCPQYLVEQEQLNNYYNQISLYDAYKNDWDFPNAIYLDGLAEGGLIRTGTKVLADENYCSIYTYSNCLTFRPKCDPGFYVNTEYSHWTCYGTYAGEKHGFCFWPWQNHYQCCRDDSIDNHDVAGYAYVDTLIAYNVKKACRKNKQGGCQELLDLLEARIEQNPLKLWDDPLTGRHSNWPVQPEIHQNYNKRILQ